MMKHHWPSVLMSPFRIFSPKSSSMRAMSTPRPVASGQLQAGGRRRTLVRQQHGLTLRAPCHCGATEAKLRPGSSSGCWQALSLRSHLIRTSRTLRSSSGRRLQTGRTSFTPGKGASGLPQRGHAAHRAAAAAWPPHSLPLLAALPAAASHRMTTVSSSRSMAALPTAAAATAAAPGAAAAAADTGLASPPRLAPAPATYAAGSPCLRTIRQGADHGSTISAGELKPGATSENVRAGFGRSRAWSSRGCKNSIVRCYRAVAYLRGAGKRGWPGVKAGTRLALGLRGPDPLHGYVRDSRSLGAALGAWCTLPAPCKLA